MQQQLTKTATPPFPQHANTAASSSSGAAANPRASSPKPSSSAPKTSSTKKTDSKTTGGATGLSYNTSQQNRLLATSEWKDKLLWASRMVLGGNSINGFLRATATVQRIKKQRARQSSLAKKTAAAAAAAEGDDAAKAAAAKPIWDQAEEETLKKEIMNPRTAKKLKSELESGMEFCTSLHNVLRSVLYDVDPHQSQYYPPPLDESSTSLMMISTRPMQASSISQYQQGSSSVSHDSSMPWTVKQSNVPATQQLQRPPPPTGSSGASTLRKSRKKKLPPSNEPPIDLPEFEGGKRTCTKKEHNYRVFELLRFRPLKHGDFVAARLSSRDLWILAKVLKDYNGFSMSNLEFLNLSEAKRDSVFRDKVMVRDVEEKEGTGSSNLVSRNLILPLPRTYSEAAEWVQRCKKGSRVYAMYPQTTSLYPATVIDSTTYCRDYDDIIVVEFDGEEQGKLLVVSQAFDLYVCQRMFSSNSQPPPKKDATGQVPKYHIPARFVTSIPREFPASEDPATQKTKRKSPNKKRDNNNMDDFLSIDFGAPGDFDSLDLDFDAPLAADEEMDAFPMI